MSILDHMTNLGFLYLYLVPVTRAGFPWDVFLSQGASQDTPLSVAAEVVLICSFRQACKRGPTSFQRVQGVHQHLTQRIVK